MTDQPPPPARRRLEQCHQLWHGALESYPEVDAFCIAINALIQALRSVTFVLQKDLAHRKGFGAWYLRWQTKLRSDSVMRWIVEARNQIEKEGDLDLRSTARVSIIAGWFPGLVDEFDAPPLLAPQAIAALLAQRQIPAEVRDEGVLKVERRWVTTGLPDQELLDACAYAYAVLDELLGDAEARYGEGEPRSTVGGHQRLPCMVAGPDARSAFLHLQAGEFMELERVAQPHSAKDEARVSTKYGEIFSRLPTLEDSLDGRAVWYHEIGRGMLEQDGAHRALAFLFRGGRPVGMVGVDPDDQQTKYLMMDALAQDVLAHGADEVICSTEAWLAPMLPPDDERARLRAGARDDRGEAFVTYGINRAGKNVTLMSQFTRVDDRIRLEQVHRSSAFPQALIPIRRAWQK